VNVSQSLVGEVGVAKTDVGVHEGVGVRLRITRSDPDEGRGVSVALPVETRAAQSMVVCPGCKAFTSNVKTGPLVVALFPLLPAIATINVPACGALTAATESVPNRFATVMLLTSASVALKVQVNSALLYPSAGTLCKVTVANVVPPTKRLVELSVVETNGPPYGVGVALANGSGVLVLNGVGVPLANGSGVSVNCPNGVGVADARGSGVFVPGPKGVGVAVANGSDVADC